MNLTARAYENGDHACLIWFPADFQAISDCRGFAIERTRTPAKGAATSEFLRNFTGFTDGATPPTPVWKWPIQRFLWWDYFVQPGDTVQYSVIPVTGSNADGTLKLMRDMASPLTEAVKITGQGSAHLASYFNKGIIASQWVSRELDQEAKGQSKKPALLDILTKPGDPLRNALSGLLRTQILQILNDVDTQGGTIFAALYELNDPDLLAAFKKLGSKVNLILGNGAFKPPSIDENEVVRKDLKDNTKINVFDRLVTSGHFAHNKFLVICDKSGTPVKVVTGSTNWTMTGLCTQANNALIIDDPAVAMCFRKQWDLLKAAGNGFPPSLVSANSVQKTFTVDGAQLTVWFVPTSALQDMEQARALIKKAKNGILFLFFNPGAFQQDAANWTLLQSVIDRHNPASADLDANLYVRGVVNQTIAGLTEGEPAGAHAPAATDPTHPVQLFDGGKPANLPKDVLVPAAIKAKFGHWEAELMSVGVMVHSKCVVLDPFGDHPVVMTGSHNLGTKASRANDDNLVILEGPGARAIAISYAVNIIAIFQEYRWRQYVAAHSQDKTAFHVLSDDDKWQDGHLKNEKSEIEFWIGKSQAASPMAGKAAPSKPPPVAAVAPATAAAVKKAPAGSPTKVAKKTAVKKTVAKKVTVKKVVAKKRVVKKAVVKKTAVKKTAVKKAVAKKSTAKKTPAKKALARKAVAKKAVAKQSVRATSKKTPKKGRAKAAKSG